MVDLFGAPGPPGTPPADDGAEIEALLRWLAADGVGPQALHGALEQVGSATALLGRPDAARILGVNGAAPGPAQPARDALDACARSDIAAVGWFDPSYPADLFHLTDPPPVLFVRGSLEAVQTAGVAVVGARAATAYGRRVARGFGRGLAAHGVPVYSGLALGIDGEAHAGALEGGGITVAVLGGGVERARPSSHRALYRAILETGGAVVGEWPPGTPARAFHFPRRNRILAALSGLVVVVEAGERSGALSTAAHARRLGREVMAVPGAVDRPQHVGTNRLIRDGCAPALELRDILDRVGVVEQVAAPAAQEPHLKGDRARVWSSLAEGPCTLEALAMRAGLSPSGVLGALTRLEAEGLVRRERGLHLRASQP